MRFTSFSRAAVQRRRQPAGCACLRRDMQGRVHEEPAARGISSVVDTTGAGDAFAAAFLRAAIAAFELEPPADARTSMTCRRIDAATRSSRRSHGADHFGSRAVASRTRFARSYAR